MGIVEFLHYDGEQRSHKGLAELTLKLAQINSR